MTHWPIISDETCSIVDKACQLAIEAQERQRALAGAPVGTPSVCHLPGGPSLIIIPQNSDALSVYSVFCFLIGPMMILIPDNVNSQSKRFVPFEGVWQTELVDLFSEVTG
jgi:hypothetical protein